MSSSGTSFHLVSKRSLRVALLCGVTALVGGCSQDIITNPKAVREEGVKLYNEANYADAAGAFRNAIRQDPRDYKSQYYLGASYDQMRQYHQAIQAYKATMDVMGQSLAGQEDKAFRARVMESLAGALTKCDNPEAEITVLEQRAKATNNPEDILLLAKALRYTSDADAAVATYTRGMLLDPKNFTMAKEAGLYFEQLGQTPRAEQALKRANSLNPNDEQVVAALRRLGVVPGLTIRPVNQTHGPPPSMTQQVRPGMTQTPTPAPAVMLPTDSAGPRD